MNKWQTGSVIIAFLAAQFWGVPFYIDKRVELRIAEMAATEGKPSHVVALEQNAAIMVIRMDNFETNQKATAAKLETLNTTIINYFSRR